MLLPAVIVWVTGLIVTRDWLAVVIDHEIVLVPA